MILNINTSVIERSQTASIDVLNWHEAVVAEVTKILPGKFSKENVQDVAIGYLIKEKNTNNYFSHAETYALELSNSRLLNFFCAIIGKRMTPAQISGIKIFNTDKLLFKHVSIKFIRSSQDRIKIDGIEKILVEKRTEFDLSKYVSPPWIKNKVLKDDEIATAVDIQSLFDLPAETASAPIIVPNTDDVLEALFPGGSDATINKS